MKPLIGAISLFCLFYNLTLAMQFDDVLNSGINYELPVEDLSPDDPDSTPEYIFSISYENENEVTLEWVPVQEAEYYEVDIKGDSSWRTYYTGSESRVALSMDVIYQQIRVRFCTYRYCSEYAYISFTKGNERGRCSTEPYCEVIGL